MITIYRPRLLIGFERRVLAVIAKALPSDVPQRTVYTGLVGRRYRIDWSAVAGATAAKMIEDAARTCAIIRSLK